jgi:hypothetical protein
MARNCTGGVDRAFLQFIPRGWPLVAARWAGVLRLPTFTLIRCPDPLSQTTLLEPAMKTRLVSRFVALGLSTLVTLATMGAVDFIAAAEGTSSALMALASSTLV